MPTQSYMTILTAKLKLWNTNCKYLASNEKTSVINEPWISTSTKVAPISDTPTTLAQKVTDPLAHVLSGQNPLH